MRVLVNASTLVVGGGVQVGVSFIQQTYDDTSSGIEFNYLVSSSIYNLLPEDIRKSPRIIRIVISPARIISGINSRSMIRGIEKKLKPDLIYSIGFPSYIKFFTIELGRYTNPWEINLGSLPWHTIEGVPGKILHYFSIKYKQYWAKRADYFETQTFAAKNGISKRIGICNDKIFVIPNTVNKLYYDAAPNIKNRSLLGRDIITVFCLSAEHLHKNLKIIPHVIEKIKNLNPRLKIKFITTLPADSRVNRDIRRISAACGVSSNIINVGPISIEQCVEYYRNSDIVFLPTLLEVFSATYIEAMLMSVPIVTTDFDFSRDVCGNAALYYNPTSPDDAANKIISLINNPELYALIVKNCALKANELMGGGDKYSRVYSMLKTVRQRGLK